MTEEEARAEIRAIIGELFEDMDGCSPEQRAAAMRKMNEVSVQNGYLPPFSADDILAVERGLWYGIRRS